MLLRPKGKIESKKVNALKILELGEYFKKCTRRYIFILDEVDFLYKKDEKVLYNLVE